MRINGINIPELETAAFCRRQSIRSLALFGSILTDEFGPGSDIDVLVEFEPSAGPSLLDFAGMQSELSELWGRAVHLHTPAMLSPRWRERVRREARVQYAA